jgi:hypothetical protein
LGATFAAPSSVEFRSAAARTWAQGAHCDRYPYLLPYEHAAHQAQLTLLRIFHGKSNITAEILMRR